MKLVLALAAATLALIFAASAGAMHGQMHGQASLTGKLNNQTVKLPGSVFFANGEDNAIVCVNLRQGSNTAYGCSKNLRNPGTATGEVQFMVTLTGSGLVYGSTSSVYAVATYSEDGVPGDTYGWPNPNVMLVN